MAAPIITPIPTPPIRSDAPADFAVKADNFAAALPQFVTETNGSASFVDQRAIDADGSAQAAAASAGAAASSVTAAANQVALATEQAGLATTNGQAQVALAADQVALATNQAVRSENAAEQSEIAAAAAGAAVGLPALTGNARKALVVRPDESGVEFAAVGSELKRSARTANFTLAAADKGWLVDITDGTFTQTFAAAATLGDGWFCYLRNNGTGDITLDPDGAELIDGLSSYVMYPGEVRLVQCDGDELRSVVLQPFCKLFAASGNLIKPPGYQCFGGLIWSGGNSGQKSGSTGTASAGGGGGGCFPFFVPHAALSNSETVVVGAGGTAVTVAAQGKLGGSTSLGALLTVYPGNPHFNGGSVINGLKASVAGAISALGFEGGNGLQSASTPLAAIWGGAAAWSEAFDASGGSLYGGGAGGGVNASASAKAAGQSKMGGNGGAASSAGNGTDGAAPGGGGGATQTGARSGAGARGELRIWGII